MAIVHYQKMHSGQLIAYSRYGALNGHPLLYFHGSPGSRLEIRFLAAFSQIALYTVFRAWVLNVPKAFQRSADDLAYLDGLVAFHVLSCLAMLVATLVDWRLCANQNEIKN